MATALQTEYRGTIITCYSVLVCPSLQYSISGMATALHTRVSWTGLARAEVSLSEGSRSSPRKSAASRGWRPLCTQSIVDRLARAEVSFTEGSRSSPHSSAAFLGWPQLCTQSIVDRLARAEVSLPEGGTEGSCSSLHGSTAFLGWPQLCTQEYRGPVSTC